jgi:hypothetical protein
MSCKRPPYHLARSVDDFNASDGDREPRVFLNCEKWSNSISRFHGVGCRTVDLAGFPQENLRKTSVHVSIGISGLKVK